MSDLSIRSVPNVTPVSSSSGAANKQQDGPPIAVIRKTSQSHDQINTTHEIRKSEKKGEKITVGEETLIKIIEKANKALAGNTTSLEFSIHDATNEVLVKVLDNETGEIIREIPSEKILDLVAKLWELAGILVDERR